MKYLHIGTHKTGSKSLQLFLADHAIRLKAAGYTLYTGNLAVGTNHTELNLACRSPDQDSFGSRRWPELAGHVYTEQVRRRLQSFFHSCITPHAIFSHEGLSLLRSREELLRLTDLLGGEREGVHILLYLRNKADFLRSYTEQILKEPGRRPSQERSSALYVEPDSWLIDYDALVKAYAGQFGRENLTIIDYDTELAQRGNVIPAFLEAIGLPSLAGTVPSPYFIHRSPSQRNRSHPGEQ